MENENKNSSKKENNAERRTDANQIAAYMYKQCNKFMCDFFVFIYEYVHPYHGSQ